MYSHDYRSIPSPDGRFEANLQAEGISSWVLTRARLSLAGTWLKDRVFDWQGVWSSCSRYFAIMEWRRDSSMQVPEARLVIMDMERDKECVLDRVERGFIEPLSVYDGRVRFVRIDLTMNRRQILDRPLDETVAWTARGERESDILRPER